MALRIEHREAGLRWTDGDRDAFDEIANAWDHCANAMEARPICDPIFMRCLAESFLSPDDRFSLSLLWQGNQLLAAVPIVREGKIPRSSVSFDNPHTPYWLFPIDLRSVGIADEVVGRLLKSSDTLVFRRMHPKAPYTQALFRAAKRLDCPVVLTHAPIADAFVRLEGSWDQFRKSLSRNLTSDIPRKLRKLEKLGRVDFEIVTSGPKLRPALDECLELETRGWKGEHGTPILTDPQALRFYTSLARGLSARNRFALYLLRFEGRLIAFEYCLRHRGRIDMLKLSFDPELSEFSPGNLLRWLLFQHEIGLGEVRTYHLGNPRNTPKGPNWKLRWATDVEPLCTLHIYDRSLVGKLCYLGGPRFRDYLKQSRTGLWLKQLLHRENAPPKQGEKKGSRAA